MFNFKILSIFLIFIFLHESDATLSKSDKKKKETPQKESESNINNDFNLNIKTDIIGKSLTHDIDLKDIKLFANGSTLAYVTPWNNYGYDIAKKFSRKFSFISPVWLRITYDGSNFEIFGSRDIDVKWIMDLKAKNPNVKIVPRLIFENWNHANFMHVVRNEFLTNQCIELIAQFLTKYNFDGLVLEMWLQIGAYAKEDALHFLSHFGSDMKDRKLVFILAIPPPIYSGNHEGLFNHQDYLKLNNVVDFYSLMTYDYSNSQNPGPNAPLEWMKRCINILEPNNNKFARSKILMGLNFYGYLYSYYENKAIVRHEFIDILKTAHKVEPVWHKDALEYEFRIKNVDGTTSSVWYPTVESVNLRIKLAESLGVGISIWEIGQGLDYFYNVL